jgi:ribonuclease HI
MLVGAEHAYSPIEKHCLALVFAIKKLRHYMLAHKVTLISKVDPLKYLMTRPMLTGRLAKWAIILTEFDITYVSQKAIKGQVLADFLAEHPIPDDSPLTCEFPDEEVMHAEEENPGWEMYFDGASSIRPTTGKQIPKVQAGIGLVFITPRKGIIRHSLALTEPCTNNEAEYEALIAGLELAIQAGIQKIRVHGDSQLVINQVLGEYKVLKPELVKYHQKAIELMKEIPEVTYVKITRASNGKADALARVAKELCEPDNDEVHIIVKNRQPLSPHFSKEVQREDTFQNRRILDNPQAESLIAEKEEDWRQPFTDYFQHGILPKEKSAQEQLKKRALRFAYVNNTLYRRSYDQLWLRCVSKLEASQIMKEVHSGLCGAHQSGPKMRLKIKRLGYYWPSMVADCEEHAKKCHLCQVHGDFIHRHPNPLHPTVASWPFDSWGTDIVGPIDPPSSGGHRFILATTDYFSKWSEAVALKEVKATDVIKFFRTRVLFRYGTPRRIISDNGTAFKNAKIYAFASQYNIDWRYSSIYNPRANGLAEAFNKTLIRLLRKMVDKNHKSWHERLPEALWAYRTTYRTPTQATPYSLVFGVEAVLPLEVEIPSLRIALQAEMPLDESAKLRLDELDAMDEKRLIAHQSLELYQAQMTRAYDKMVRPRTFRKGELVLILKRPIIGRHTGPKFSANWEGPYIIEQVFEGGAYQLVDHLGVRVTTPINGRYLKKYHV